MTEVRVPNLIVGDPNDIPDENVIQVNFHHWEVEELLDWMDENARMWIVKSKEHKRCYAVQWHNYDGLNLWTCTCPGEHFNTICTHILKCQNLVVEGR